MSELGEKIKALREARNFSQQDLANMVNVHQTKISFVERGKRGVSFSLACKLAHALDVPVTELVPASLESERVPA